MAKAKAPDLDQVQKLADGAYLRTPPSAPYGILYQNPPLLMSTQTFMWFDSLPQLVEFLKTNALFELDQSGEWNDRKEIKEINSAAIRIATEGIINGTLGPLGGSFSSMEIVWVGSFDDLCSSNDSVSKAIIGNYFHYCCELLDNETEGEEKVPRKSLSSIAPDDLDGFAEFISSWNERNG